MFSSSSRVCWGGKTTFSENTATCTGRVIHMNGFMVSWSGATSFYNNGSGGALSRGFSAILWNGPKHFTDNSVANLGGVHFGAESTIFWCATMNHIGNKNEVCRGSIYLAHSAAS